MPCMCGATDCPSCGPDQGYEVVRGPTGYYNPIRCTDCRNEFNEYDLDDEGLCQDCHVNREVQAKEQEAYEQAAEAEAAGLYGIP